MAKAVNKIRKMRGSKPYHATPWSQWYDVEHHAMDGCGNMIPDPPEDADFRPCIFETSRAGEPSWIAETMAWAALGIDGAQHVLLFHPTSHFSWDEYLWDVDGGRCRVRGCSR